MCHNIGVPTVSAETMDRVGSVRNVTQTLIVQILFFFSSFLCYFLYLCRVLLKLLFTKNGRTEHFAGRKNCGNYSRLGAQIKQNT